MAKTPSTEEQNAAGLLMLNLHSVDLTDEQFYQLCQDNPDLRFELTAKRELVIMPPTGSKTGWRNSKLNQRLANWAEADGTGVSFDSSTGFTLPDGAKRSPDAAWVRRQAWEALTDEQQEEFAPVCPDFVLELRSAKDGLAGLEEKMKAYIENGARLGWLVEAKNRRIYVYRPNHPVECFENPSSISGEPLLPGFVFDPSEIW
ncbi:MAG TPA: Uma2 family endonuclease [Blastocatellia bacterium]|nr:Uma2 family endonuclease [Blastocatellia bacterium]